MTPVRKEVFPVVGLGTRFLPATKSVPKEMLPLVDRPPIQYAIDEAHSNETRQALGDEAYKQLLSRFIDEVDGLCAWLVTKPTTGDIQERIHKIAGSAAIFGATKLRAASIAIGNAAKAGQCDLIKQNIAILHATWAGTKRVLQT